MTNCSLLIPARLYSPSLDAPTKARCNKFGDGAAGENEKKMAPIAHVERFQDEWFFQS